MRHASRVLESEDDPEFFTISSSPLRSCRPSPQSGEMFIETQPLPETSSEGAKYFARKRASETKRRAGCYKHFVPNGTTVIDPLQFLLKPPRTVRKPSDT